MDWGIAHQGARHQGSVLRSRTRRAGQINPDLHAPLIVNPADEPEVNLHGDIPGSPYSSTPGEISLADARAQATPSQRTPN